MSRARIVATIGPATDSAESIRELIAAGMNIARLNGSHNDLDWHRATIRMLRETAPTMPILLDIPGRKIRTTQLAHEPVFAEGDIITLTTDPGYDGLEKVPVNYDRLHEDLKPGDNVLADDGTLRFTVVEIDGRDMLLRAEVPGQLKSRKGINVPFVELKTEQITDRDRQMIAFAKDTGVDYVGISFVESGSHVEAIREMTGGISPQIVSKIENQRGLERMEEVIAATDAVMIDRGDLSIETNLETLAVNQKRIIKMARKKSRPVIVATEMLHTMIVNSFPTKAEVTDITNAVLDGCAAVMLSGETAIGAHPVASVSVMRRIADAAEEHLQSNLDSSAFTNGVSTIPQAIEDAIALICRNLPITKVIAVTKSGFAAHVLAARQIRQPIYGVSNDAIAARGFNLYPGVEGIHVDIEFSRDSTDHIICCVEELWRRDKISDEDFILITAVGYPRSGNRMNLIQTHIVADLIESLGWSK